MWYSNTMAYQWGIKKKKKTEMGEFNSDDHYSMTVSRNPLKEME